MDNPQLSLLLPPVQPRHRATPLTTQKELFLYNLWVSARTFWQQHYFRIEPATRPPLMTLGPCRVLVHCLCECVLVCSRKKITKILKRWFMVGWFFSREGLFSTIDIPINHPTSYFNQMGHDIAPHEKNFYHSDTRQTQYILQSEPYDTFNKTSKTLHSVLFYRVITAHSSQV